MPRLAAAFPLGVYLSTDVAKLLKLRAVYTTLRSLLRWLYGSSPVKTGILAVNPLETNGRQWRRTVRQAIRTFVIYY